MIYFDVIIFKNENDFIFNKIALLDTGASDTYVSEYLANNMNLEIIGSSNVVTGNKSISCDKAIANIKFKNHNKFIKTEVLIMEDRFKINNTQYVDIFIGKNIYKLSEFIYDQGNYFSFEIPKFK